MLSVYMNVYNYTHVLLECNQYELSIIVFYTDYKTIINHG